MNNIQFSAFSHAAEAVIVCDSETSSTHQEQHNTHVFFSFSLVADERRLDMHIEDSLPKIYKHIKHANQNKSQVISCFAFLRGRALRKFQHVAVFVNRLTIVTRFGKGRLCSQLHAIGVVDCTDKRRAAGFGTRYKVYRHDALHPFAARELL